MTASALLVPLAPAALGVLTARIVVAGGRAADRAAFVAAVGGAGVRQGQGVVLDLCAARHAVPSAPDLAGALGAVVLADPRWPGPARTVLDACEDAGVAVAVAVADGFPHDALRAALDLDEAVPLVPCVPADPGSARAVLRALLRAGVVATV
ncbi:hypothetical protein EDD29_1631 [Actinocorallia herbida]|uniref:Uncharacterized protein n=1 Tax=Actinocorallia herbida TaxID=58109 RepID=A0A3N1CSH2_9ACTN|nr:hypothetical protein [Actinocorallia herbida]ROO84114.1 hypothetical protein EDD29_1631 [Actinocorallia herbida]